MDIKTKEVAAHEYGVPVSMMEMKAHECEDVAHEYEVPFSMKECEAYAKCTLPYKP